MPTPLPLDLVGRALRDWQREREDLDLSPAYVLARVRRLMSLLEPALDPPLARYGLNHAAFDTLSTLRRAGRPYTMSARDLAAQCLRTPATLSARIARLQQDGLVSRSPDPEDGRGVLISLTEQGKELIDTVAPVYLATEKLLLSGIDEHQQEVLAEILHTLLLTFEGFDTTSETGRKTGAVPSLGLQLESLHTSIQIRRAVGVSDRIGMLVASVSPGGPGARAGLVRGDLVLDVDGTSPRSIPRLNHELQLLESDTVQVTFAREGEEDRKVSVTLAQGTSR